MHSFDTELSELRKRFHAATQRILEIESRLNMCDDTVPGEFEILNSLYNLAMEEVNLLSKENKVIKQWKDQTEGGERQ